MKAHGDWVSDFHRDYIELSRAMRLTCARKMFHLYDRDAAVETHDSVDTLGHIMPAECQVLVPPPPGGAELPPLGSFMLVCDMF